MKKTIKLRKPRMRHVLVMMFICLLQSSVHASVYGRLSKNHVVDWNDFEKNIPGYVQGVDQQEQRVLKDRNKVNKLFLWRTIASPMGQSTCINTLLQNKMSYIRYGSDSDSDNEGWELNDKNNKGPVIGMLYEGHDSSAVDSYWDKHLGAYHVDCPSINDCYLSSQMCISFGVEGTIKKAREFRGIVIVLARDVLKSKEDSVFGQIHQLFQRTFISPDKHFESTLVIFTKGKRNKFVSFLSAYFMNLIVRICNQEIPNQNSLFTAGLMSHLFKIPSSIRQEVEGAFLVEGDEQKSKLKPIKEHVKQQIKKNILCIDDLLIKRDISMGKEDKTDKTDEVKRGLAKFRKAFRKSKSIKMEAVKGGGYPEDHLKSMKKRIEEQTKLALSYCDKHEKLLKQKEEEEFSTKIIERFFPKSRLQGGVIGGVIGGIIGGVVALTLVTTPPGLVVFGAGMVIGGLGGLVAGKKRMNAWMREKVFNEDSVLGLKTKMCDLDAILDNYLVLVDWMSTEDLTLLKSLNEAKTKLGKVLGSDVAEDSSKVKKSNKLLVPRGSSHKKEDDVV